MSKTLNMANIVANIIKFINLACLVNLLKIAKKVNWANMFNLTNIVKVTVKDTTVNEINMSNMKVIAVMAKHIHMFILH
ncbi:hypothetical protein BgiBS90_030610, partial [Biomphalaria glabrata]